MTEMKLLIILLLSALCLNSTEAAYILVKKNSEGVSSLLSEKDPEFSRAILVLKESEWPRVRSQLTQNPELERESEYQALLSSKKEAEEDFLNHQLGKNSFQNISAIWVPQTLWDLSVIQTYLEEPNQERLFNFSPSDLNDNLGSEVLLGQLQTLVAPKLIKIFEEKKIDFTRLLKSEEYEEVLKEVMGRIIQAELDLVRKKELNAKNTEIPYSEQRSLNSFLGYNLVFVRQFKPEYEEMQRGRETLLKRALRLELEAHEKNENLIWRSTPGILLNLPQEGKVEVLDYFFDKSKRVDLEVLVETEQPYALSFADSILGGFIYDGPSSAQSACTYDYVTGKKSQRFTYALSLEKKWQLHEGIKWISFPSLPQNINVLGSGEKFHPKTKGLKGMYAGEKFEFSVFKPHTALEQHLFSQIQWRMRERLNASEKTQRLYSYMCWMESQKSVFDRGLHLMTRDAKVVSESLPEAKQVLKNQHDVFQTLLQAIH